MLYSLIAWDVPNSLPLRKQVRPQHLARVQALKEAGRLVVAGPHPALDCEDPGDAGFTGSLIVAEFDSLDDAIAWLREDPYVTEGVFERFEVKPFKQVLP